MIGEFLYYGKNFINNNYIDTKNMILSEIQLIIAISQIVTLVFACSQVSIQVLIPTIKIRIIVACITLLLLIAG